MLAVFREAGGGPEASSSSNRFGRVLSDLVAGPTVDMFSAVGFGGGSPSEASAGREVRRVAQETRVVLLAMW